MIDPKTDVKATEMPVVDKELPEGDAPFSTEPTEESTVETPEKSTEISDEAEEIAKTIKPGEETAEKPETETNDEVDKIIKEVEGEDTSNVQKRIDKLTAELKSLKAENAKLQNKPAEERVYTEEQLAHAMMKAVEDNNPDLMRDVIAEIKSGVKKELVKMYSDEKEMSAKQVNAIESEWKETVDAYKKYADTKIPQIWANSHKDLDLTSATSLLYQVAMALYHNSDSEKAAYYHQSGGQKLAVADAMAYLIRTKVGKRTDTKVKTLEKQLTKERMKKSPVSGGPSGEDKTPRGPRSHQDTLAEVIEERKKFQDERSQ